MAGLNVWPLSIALDQRHGRLVARLRLTRDIADRLMQQYGDPLLLGRLGLAGQLDLAGRVDPRA